MRPRLLVVEHVPFAHLGTLRPALARLDVDVVRVHQGESIPSPDQYAGVVVLGGPQAAFSDEDFPSRLAEIALVQDTLTSSTPLLGICLGAQLLALAAGAEVYRAPTSEVGWRALSPTPEAETDLLFSTLPPSLLVPESHADHFTLPPDAVLLARGEDHPYQAFRVGKVAWGVQFHPEADEAWFKERTSLLSFWHEAGVDSLPPSTSENLARLLPVVLEITRRFAALVASDPSFLASPLPVQ